MDLSKLNERLGAYKSRKANSFRLLLSTKVWDDQAKGFVETDDQDQWSLKGQLPGSEWELVVYLGGGAYFRRGADKVYVDLQLQGRKGTLKVGDLKIDCEMSALSERTSQAGNAYVACEVALSRPVGDRLLEELATGKKPPLGQQMAGTVRKGPPPVEANTTTNTATDEEPPF